MKLFIVLLLSAAVFAQDAPANGGNSTTAADNAGTDNAQAGSDDTAAGSDGTNADTTGDAAAGSDGTNDDLSLTDATSNWVGAASNTLSNSIANAIDTSANATNEFLGIGKEGAKMTVDVGADLGIAGVSLGKAGAGAIISSGQSVMKGLGNMGAKSISTVGKIARLTPFFGSTLERFFSGISNGVTNATNAVSGVIDSVKKTGGGALDKANELIANGKTKINEVGDTVSKSVASGIRTVGKGASGVTKSAFDASKKASQGVVKAVGNLG